MCQCSYFLKLLLLSLVGTCGKCMQMYYTAHKMCKIHEKCPQSTLDGGMLSSVFLYLDTAPNIWSLLRSELMAPPVD